MGKKVIIVGHIGDFAQKRELDLILAERGIKHEDVIVVNSAEQIQNLNNEIKAMGFDGAEEVNLDSITKENPFQSDSNTMLIKALPKMGVYEPIRVDLKELNKHPFDRFIGKKRKRR